MKIIDRSRIRLAFFVFVGVTSACAGAATPIELTFYDNAGDVGAAKDISVFEGRNPDIKIKLITFASEEYKTQLRVAVAGGNIPDVYATNGGETFWEYVERGAAMDLTDVAKQRSWPSRTYPEFMAIDTDKDGRIWGMPWSTTQYWQSLFYDKGFFQQHNIPIPKTIEEMGKVATKIKQNGRYAIAFGDKDGWPAIIMLGDLLMQQVRPDLIGKLNTGELKWTEFEPARKAFQAIKELTAEQAFAPGFISMNHEAAIMAWVGRRTAMLYNGTWWPEVAKTASPGFEIGVMSFPMLDPAKELQGTQFGASIQILISSKLEGTKKDAAIRFVDFLVSDEGMTLYGDAKAAPTSNPVANQKITNIAPFFREPVFTRQGNLPKMVEYLDHAFPIPVIEVIKVELQKVMQNQTTIDEALAAIESAHGAERTKTVK